MEVVMDIMKHIGFIGFGIVLVGSLIGAPAFAGDKHDKHIADGSKVMITSPKDRDKVGDSFELKYELSNGSRGGHAHVFVDNEYQRGFKGTLKGLSKGEHQITVKAANEDHASVAATHTITVDVQ
jgi:FKBP-type peptidyl-prolyl cis-trans isomerase (trigger factor)